MKNFFSMLAIAGCIAVSSCSTIPENNDPVLGVWINTQLSEGAIAKNTDGAIGEEWYFNDVFLGRYQRFSRDGILYSTDFSWEVVNGVYTVDYLDSEMSPNSISLQLTSEDDVLQHQNGAVFAIRK